MSHWAIETRHLTKRFGRKAAVNDVSIRVPTGSVVGFLGPNGSGKTTCLRMMMGHLHPTEGEVATLGGNPWRHSQKTLQRIGYVSQWMGLPRWMTAGQAIAMNERLFPRWNRPLAEELLDEFKLRGTAAYGRLSGGQQRKLIILLALAQSPDLLILDEPEIGMDVESCQIFLQRILDIACDGDRTVLLSSHSLSNVERLVNRIILIRSGRVVMEGELDSLKAGVRKLQILADVAEPVLREHFDVLSLSQPALNETLATVSNFSDERAARFVSTLRNPELMRVHQFNLEQLYLELK